MALTLKERVRKYRQRLKDEGFREYLIHLNPDAQKWLERIMRQEDESVSGAVHIALRSWSDSDGKEKELASAEKEEK